LADARDRRELVQHAVDLHCGDGRTAQRRQKYAAKRVAEGKTEAALERFCHERGLGATRRGELHLVRLDQFLPVFLDHVFCLPFATTIQSWRPSLEEPAARGTRRPASR